MAGRRGARNAAEPADAAAGERWAAQVAALDARGPAGRPRREAITVDRIVRTALRLVEVEGYDALTMRRVAAILETGPASLYAHVRNKAELDDLLIGELCGRVELPVPDAERWRAQVIDVCGQVRDQYLRYPGISQAAFAAVPASLNTMALSEGMLGIMLAGRVPPQSAAWAIDACFLYVNAYSLEASLSRRPGQDADERVVDRATIAGRIEGLPVDRFPHSVAHARQLTSGDGHERFDFTLTLLLGGLDQLDH